MVFLICGFGSIGYRHARVLTLIGGHSLWAYRTGHSSVPESVRGDVRIERELLDLDEALASRPDGVLVTNPTSLHVSTALKAVKAGIPVFIEKPLGHDLEEAEALCGIAEEKGVPILVGYNMLFHPALAKMKELVASGALGEVITASVYWGSFLPGWHPWEDYKESYAARFDLGGGAVLTMSHELNFLTDLFGRVERVRAFETKRRVLGISADEGAVIILEHARGVVADVQLNFVRNPSRRTCHITGMAGSICWDYARPEVVLETSQGRRVFDWPMDSTGLLDVSYERQMRHFIDVAARKAAPRVSARRGMEDLKLCLDIRKEMGR